MSDDLITFADTVDRNTDAFAMPDLLRQATTEEATAAIRACFPVVASECSATYESASLPDDNTSISEEVRAFLNQLPWMVVTNDSHLLNHLPDPNDRDDVRQEALLCLWQSLLHKEVLWLFLREDEQSVRVRLQCLCCLHLRWALGRFFRDRRKHIRAGTALDDANMPAAPPWIPIHFEEQAWLLLGRAIMRLRTRLQQVVRDQLEGLSVAESAVKNGLRPGSIKTLRSNARVEIEQALREFLSDLPLAG